MANGRGLYLSSEKMATDKNLKAGNVIKMDDGNYYAYNSTYAEKQFCGSSLADAYGSISTNLSYRNLTLSMLGSWSVGGKVYDTTYSYLTRFASSNYYALHTDLLDAWTAAPEGITEEYFGAGRIDAKAQPRMDLSTTGALFSSQQTAPASSRFLANASYFMMRNVTLQYTLPQSVASRLDLQGVSFTASCENMFTITARKGLNPQFSLNGSQGATYVPARVISIGANVKF